MMETDGRTTDMTVPAAGPRGLRQIIFEFGNKGNTAHTPEALEFQAIDRQSWKAGALSVSMIAVSFIHMVAALALYSGAHWIEQLAAGLLTLMVDLATAFFGGYFDYAKRRNKSRSWLVKASFGLSLVISFALNFAYLYAHIPAKEKANIPDWASILLCVVFALFIPMFIGTMSLIRGELIDDRVQFEQELAEQAQRPVIVEPQPSRPAPRPRYVPTSRPRPSALETSNEALRTPNGAGVVQPAALPAQASDEALEVAPIQSDGNMKAPFAASDVEAIVQTLREAGMDSFRTGAELNRLCGWSSPGTGTKAIRNLQAADLIDETTDDGGRLFVLRAADPAKPSHEGELPSREAGPIAVLRDVDLVPASAPPAQHEGRPSQLDTFLRHAGMTRDQAHKLIADRKLSAARAYSLLSTFGKLPRGMTEKTFTELYNELMA